MSQPVLTALVSLRAKAWSSWSNATPTKPMRAREPSASRGGQGRWPRSARMPDRSSVPMPARQKMSVVGAISRSTALVATKETPQKTTARNARGAEASVVRLAARRAPRGPRASMVHVRRWQLAPARDPGGVDVFGGVDEVPAAVQPGTVPPRPAGDRGRSGPAAAIGQRSTWSGSEDVRSASPAHGDLRGGEREWTGESMKSQRSWSAKAGPIRPEPQLALGTSRVRERGEAVRGTDRRPKRITLVGVRRGAGP